MPNKDVLENKYPKEESNLCPPQSPFVTNKPQSFDDNRSHKLLYGRALILLNFRVFFSGATMLDCKVF